MQWKNRLIIFIIVALAVFLILSIRYFLLPHCEKYYLGIMPCPSPSWTEVQQQYKEMTFIYIQAAVLLSFILTLLILIIDMIKFFISRKKTELNERNKK